MKPVLGVLLFSALFFIQCSKDSTTPQTKDNTNSQKKDSTVTQTKESQTKMTPVQALQMLKDGNTRFVAGKELNRNLMQQVQQTSKGQYPYAVVLSCIDSRASSELIFDQGIGDIFNARIAGNIVDEDALGGMEFSCKVMGAKLIVVLGHTSCGAIKGACDKVELGNLTTLLKKIEPVVASVKSEGDRSSKNHEFVEEVSKENVMYGIKEIKEKSPVLKKMIDKGEIAIVGGMYDIETGKVTFYEK
jgi:carbonic anhydrase